MCLYINQDILVLLENLAFYSQLFFLTTVRLLFLLLLNRNTKTRENTIEGTPYANNTTTYFRLQTHSHLNKLYLFIFMHIFHNFQYYRCAPVTKCFFFFYFLELSIRFKSSISYTSSFSTSFLQQHGLWQISSLGNCRPFILINLMDSEQTVLFSFQCTVT